MPQSKYPSANTSPVGALSALHVPHHHHHHHHGLLTTPATANLLSMSPSDGCPLSPLSPGSNVSHFSASDNGRKRKCSSVDLPNNNNHEHSSEDGFSDDLSD